MKKTVSLIIITLVGLVFLYLSRFWIFNLWERSGLFGIKTLSPNGGLVGRWVRGTDLAPFELLIWIIGVFLILTLLQRAFDRISPP